MPDPLPYPSQFTHMLLFLFQRHSASQYAFLHIPHCFPAYILSHFSHVQLFVTPWTVARQAPQSMGFSRQEYWSGLPLPSPGDLPNPGIKLVSLYVSCVGKWALYH